MEVKPSKPLDYGKILHDALEGEPIKRGGEKGKIEKEHLTRSSYIEFCRMYITENIFNELSVNYPITFLDISSKIKRIRNDMFSDLGTETSKMLLLNKIYYLFMELGFQLDKDFLYQKVNYITEFNPRLK